MQRNAMDFAKLEIIAAFTSELRKIKGLISSLADAAYLQSNRDEYDQMYNSLLGVESLLHVLETVTTKEEVEKYFFLITTVPSTEEAESL